MSEFGNTIKAIAPKCSVRELAERTGLDPTNLSRILTSSGGRGLHPSTLKRICTGLTSAREEQAELLASYLRDIRIPSLAAIVEVRVVRRPAKHHAAAADESPASALASLAGKLDAASAKALWQIAQNLHNRSLRRTILGLGEVAAGSGSAGL